MSEGVFQLWGDHQVTPDAGDPEARSAPSSDVRVIQGLSGLLLELSRERPVVICVDDLHFADDASLQVLLSLCRRVRSSRVLLVLTEWARPDLLRSPARTEIIRHPHHRITLEPLPVAGIRALLAESLADADRAAALAPG